jgi:hypothetical protein
MATIALDRVWINLWPSGESVAAQSTDRTRSTEAQGEVRTYAGGRQRSITKEGVGRQFAFTLRMVTWVQIQTLESWIGRTVQVRDHRGTRYFGVFQAVTPVEIRGLTVEWDCQIAVREVTVVEGV